MNSVQYSHKNVFHQSNRTQMPVETVYLKDDMSSLIWTSKN